MGKPKAADYSPKPRKEWRDPEGSIIRKIARRRDRFGKLKDVEQIFARVRYTDAEGKRREKKRLVASAGDAVIVRRQLQLEIEEELNPPAASEKPVEVLTFNQVLDFYESEFVKAAVYSNDSKIEGYKENLDIIRYQIKLFRAEFGEKLITEIDYDDVRNFKIKRLQMPVVIEYWEKIPLSPEETAALPPKSRRRCRVEKHTKTRPRKFASVHRELARLRRIFNIAVRKGWRASNPFSTGETLIQPSLEVERLRICSFEEEKRLLAECRSKRLHLKSILIFAIDTAMRKSEIFKLLWRDVDLENRRIFVQATNTKTGKSRIVPMTKRVAEAIEPLAQTGTPDSRVFGIATDADRGWETLLEKTGIEDLRFHDLRATAITRMLRAGLAEAEVMKISGHTQYKTFLKYVRQDGAGTNASATLLDRFLDNNSEA